MPGTLPPLNLSDATKLKDVEFRPRTSSVKWISAALRTAKPQNIQRVAILFYIPLMSSVIRNPAEAMTRLEWQELDHLLVQLWTTRSIRPVFTYYAIGDETSPGVLVPQLLPELVRGGFDPDSSIVFRMRM